MQTPLSVAELIAKLQTLPQDIPVGYYSYDDYQDAPVSWPQVEDVELIHNDEGTLIAAIS